VSTDDRQPLKALLVSEGKHGSSGALETLVRRLRDSGLEIEQDKVSSPNVRVHPGKGKGYFKRALRWMLEAEDRGYDALILLIDRDDQRERVAQFNEAQNSTITDLKRALGVAIRTFDAWMLADEQALTSVLEFQIQRQPEPEEIRDPKSSCRAILDQAGYSMSQSAMYSAVANATDLGVLVQRCPAGFAPFAQRVRAL
jgi:hypothetical protein